MERNVGIVGHNRFVRDDGNIVDVYINKYTKEFIHNRILDYKNGKTHFYDVPSVVEINTRLVTIQTVDMKSSYWILDNKYIYYIEVNNEDVWDFTEPNTIRQKGKFRNSFFICKMYVIGQETLDRINMVGNREFTEGEIEALSKIKTTSRII
jgi:hypothetical protein